MIGQKKQKNLQNLTQIAGIYPMIRNRTFPFADIQRIIGFTPSYCYCANMLSNPAQHVG
jgi:hypothetical protein